MALRAHCRAGLPKQLSEDCKTLGREENMMLENTNTCEDEMEKQTILADTAELSKHSRWDDFFLTLKLVAVASAILGAILGIDYLLGR